MIFYVWLGDELEDLCNLLFELSNEDRLRVLHYLREEPSKVSGLARALGITNQEASRHLSRLTEAKVVLRDADGLFNLTPLGELVLTQLRGLSFVAEHPAYFASHLLNEVPQRFLCRLCELEASTPVDDIMVVLYNVERVIDEAEEHVWRLTDRYDMMALPELEEATGRGVEFRLMQTRGFEYPPDWSGTGIILRDARLKGVFNLKVSDEANVFLAISEKEVAALSFPTQSGRFDYLGFTSKDERVINWCHELYEYYWEKARWGPGFGSG